MQTNQMTIQSQQQQIFQDNWLFVNINGQPFVRSLQTANIYPLIDLTQATKTN